MIDDNQLFQNVVLCCAKAPKVFSSSYEVLSHANNNVFDTFENKLIIRINTLNLIPDKTFAHWVGNNFASKVVDFDMKLMRSVCQCTGYRIDVFRHFKQAFYCFWL